MHAGFVAPFEEKLIRSIWVQNSNNVAKVSLQRRLAILKENRRKQNEAMNIIGSFEKEVSKWRAIVSTIWRVERAQVEKAIVAFAEAVKSNHQLWSRVDDVFIKLVSTRLDGDQVFGRYKDVLKEKDDLAGKVEYSAKERETLDATVTNSARVIVDLQLRDSELAASNLQAMLNEGEGGEQGA